MIWGWINRGYLAKCGLSVEKPQGCFSTLRLVTVWELTLDPRRKGEGMCATPTPSPWRDVKAIGWGLHPSWGPEEAAERAAAPHLTLLPLPCPLGSRAYKPRPQLADLKSSSWNPYRLASQVREEDGPEWNVCPEGQVSFLTWFLTNFCVKVM